MFAMVAALFFALWLVGVLAVSAAGAAIHVLLALAAVSLASHFVLARSRGQRPVRRG